jgi:F-type H+-transporting ATPase subunit b
MADTTPEVFATTAADPEVHATVEHGAVVHAEPTLLGFAPYQWVAVAMLVLILIAIFGAKVHKTIGGGLDRKIAAIRDQLDEAKKLREEAEALRAEYAAKIAGAEKDAEAMIERAKVEADQIVEKAEADTAAMIGRRKQMAEDKIAAAERSAIEELRAKVATTATMAARELIAEKHGEADDRKLADEIIANI